MENNTAIIDGIIEFISDEKKVTDKFTCREVVIDTGGQYPQLIKCQLVNQKCDLIISKHKGDKIIAHVSIRGRKSNGQKGVQYFTSLDILKIE